MSEARNQFTGQFGVAGPNSFTCRRPQVSWVNVPGQNAIAGDSASGVETRKEFVSNLHRLPDQVLEGRRKKFADLHLLTMPILKFSQIPNLLIAITNRPHR